MTGESFRSLISSLNARAVEGERRKVPRVGVRFVTQVCPLEGDRMQPAETVRVRDVSPNGIGLMHRRKMRTGDKFVLQFPQETGGPLQILCEVRSSNTVSPSVHSVGASFLKIGYEGVPAPAPAAAAKSPAHPGASSQRAAPAPAAPRVPAYQAAPTGADGLSKDSEALAEQIRRAMFGDN